eukprot:GFUD01100983.1.p1 GENE.GFUD01100983.1~~GFUD01100983.1.p1  ORF type:complete len:105 (+),score=13.10 GFUD01100983.1:82-396(+)
MPYILNRLKLIWHKDYKLGHILLLQMLDSTHSVYQDHNKPCKGQEHRDGCLGSIRQQELGEQSHPDTELGHMRHMCRDEEILAQLELQSGGEGTRAGTSCWQSR